MTKAEKFIEEFKRNTPDEGEFKQAVEEVFSDALEKGDCEHLWHLKIPQQMVMPDRIIEFRVSWQDEKGEVHMNRAWRVQHSNAVGPYKGGLRFAKGLKLDTLKFLAFEQSFKNALVGLPMGGAKGGADFDPIGKSDSDIMRFCHAFMMELYRYIGPDIDVPAGDIGVGEREIGYLFGAYKKITNQFHGVLTGKDPGFSGSCVRKEATGYGVVYFLKEALEYQNKDLAGKRCAISGAGNVARYTAEKLMDMDAKVISISERSGTAYMKDGLTREGLKQLHKIKEEEHGSLEDFVKSYENCEFREGKKPWDLECDIALPCATQNELDKSDAQNLLDNKVICVCEAANMPLTKEARELLREKDLLVLPSKAINAGGVAVSGLERSQNAQRLTWEKDRVDQELQQIMGKIHALCVEHGKNGDVIDYTKGANIAAFERLSRAMKAYGVI